MLSRKAILIGAPSVETYLPGVVQDIKDMKAFLCSPIGGAWRENEIITLVDQSKATVTKHLNSCADVDYVFILCAGHGEHQVLGTNGSTVIYLTEEDTLSIDSINTRGKRQFVIADVCRHERKITISESLLKAAMESYSAEDKFDYRAAFDSAVMSCSEGRIVAYSCSVNQSAGEDEKGGAFTQALIASPNAYLPERSHGIVNVKQAFDWAYGQLTKKSSAQTPVFNAGRRLDYYPFAVITK